MTVSLNLDAIRARAAAFAKEFNGISSEKRYDQNFMRQFCEVFGISPNRIAWQFPVKQGKSTNWIDGLLPGLLLMEMKSANKSLDEAYTQASGYMALLGEEHLPASILVSDFARLRLYRRETGDYFEVTLSEFADHIEEFLFLAGYEALALQQEQAANEQAAEKMAELYDAIKSTGYEGKDLESYLVRLLFCLFADDTGLFGENGRFLDLLVNHTKIDGSDLHGTLGALFDTLNRADTKRPRNLPEHLRKFPHVNGALFKDALAQCYFDEKARNTLIECAKLDWSQISPAIFGALFQAIMHFDDEEAKAKTKKRREFGAHYTSEANILKVIRPLFLDGLWEEFERIRRDRKKLEAFHKKLAGLNFFDPACGCGNFLVIAYRELRLLELDVIEAMWGNTLSGHLDIDTLILCNVHQFHGIEIDGSAAQIAKVALWLTDHQMNLRVQRFGNYYKRLPLNKEANIRCGNALRMDWAEVVPPDKCGFIMGNPPFIGAKYMSDEQRADIAPIFKPLKNGGLLDYVAAWHVKATGYIKGNPDIPVAFVSTNSICQGEQVGVLWPWLLQQGVKIRFAHRTFRWSNEGKGVAAVHCVILGLGLSEPAKRIIFDYGDDISGEPVAVSAKNINPYLADAPDVVIDRRNKPLCDAPEMVSGNKPIDDGNYLFTPEQKTDFVSSEPASEKFFKRWLGGEEFINGIERWCLWLGNVEPHELNKLPKCMDRVKAVRKFRAASKSTPTQNLAEYPRRFHTEFISKGNYLAMPQVSSERREFIPIAFLDSSVLCGDKLRLIDGATLYHFGVLCSFMHMAWTRTTCGRLKSDYQYSAKIVYNNYPWPNPTPAQIKTIEAKAQAVLDARAAHPGSTLADLYDPDKMPDDLAKAHAALDKAVDNAYGYKGGKHDAARVAFLFGLYQQLAAPAVPVEPTRPARAKKKPGL